MLRTVTFRVKVNEIIDLRHKVLREDLPLETARFEGDEDQTTWHFAAFLADEHGNPIDSAIGCASFMLCPLNGESAWQLRGMATHPDYQGQGIGGLLLAFAQESLIRKGIRLFWCNARLPAVPFYERHGWQCISEIFDIPTAGPHRKMMLLRQSSI